MPDPLRAYSSKAEKYARYRWDYPSEAIEAIFQIAGLNRNSQIADIGAGTGILTRHFVGRVARVYAIEPNPEMRRLAGLSLTGQAGCLVSAGTAEASGLASAALDLITAGQAVHWFEPQTARAEFQRILKPGGWLALVRNVSTAGPLSEAIQSLNRPEYGVDFGRAAQPLPGHPEDHYFKPGESQKLTFPFSSQQNWESFFGSMLSASYMPDEEAPGWPDLKDAAQAIFTRFSQAGLLRVSGLTEVWVGPIARGN
jgi:SAM-dependent methyltransferase